MKIQVAPTFFLAKMKSGKTEFLFAKWLHSMCSISGLSKKSKGRAGEFHATTEGKVRAL